MAPAEVNRSLQTIGVTVENKSGVLARVADLFARRGFNIHSLAVAPTTDERFSRINIVVNVESAPLEQVVKQLFKLVNVIEIEELVLESAVERELLVAKVKVAEEADSTNLVSLLEPVSGQKLSEADGQATLSVEANPSQLDGFEAELNKQFEVISASRSGRIGLPKIGQDVAVHRVYQSQNA